jgi:hypothetical protein
LKLDPAFPGCTLGFVIGDLSHSGVAESNRLVEPNLVDVTVESRNEAVLRQERRSVLAVAESLGILESVFD